MFWTLFGMPVLPVQAQWVTASRTIPLASYPRSAAAAYLRWWAPVLAVVVLVGARWMVGVSIAGVLAALCGWSWSWRALRGKRAQERSDWFLLAYGARCRPERWAFARRRAMVGELGAAWERESTRTTDEVSRAGPRDVREAVLAFGLRYLASMEPDSGDARAATERLMRGDYAGVAAMPYRDAGRLDAVALRDALAAALAAGRLPPPTPIDGPDEDEDDDEAAAADEVDEVDDEPPSLAHAAEEAQREQERARSAVRDRRLTVAKQTFQGGAAAAAGAAIYAALTLGPQLVPPKTFTLAELAHPGALGGQRVAVSCESITPVGELEMLSHDSHGSTTRVCRVSLCAQGDQRMAVISELDEPPDTRDVSGVVTIESRTDRDWYDELPSDPPAMTTYLAPRTLTGLQTVVGCGVLCAIGLGLMLTGYVRRRRAMAES